MTFSEWLTTIGLCATLIAFVVGLFQYRQAQRWQALRFVSNEIKNFFADRDVRNVLLMLDVNGRPIDFRVVANGEERFKTIVVSDEMIIAALRPPSLREDKSITSTDGLIRDTFNVFFEYLTRIGSYVEASRVINYDDFYPFLRYWLDILANRHNGRKSPLFAEIIAQHLEYYEYDSVQRMFLRHQDVKQQHESGKHKR